MNEPPLLVAFPFAGAVLVGLAALTMTIVLQVRVNAILRTKVWESFRPSWRGYRFFDLLYIVARTRRDSSKRTERILASILLAMHGGVILLLVAALVSSFLR